MQRQTWSGIVIAAVFAISGVVIAQSPASQPAAQTPSASQPAAQTPSTPAPPATQSAPAQPASANRVTVTGCLREASPSAAATSGSSAPAPTDAKGNASAESKYVLADAIPSSPSAPAGGATASSPATSSSPQTYHLIANDTALAPHVGKKLEFTGTVESKGASGEMQLHAESARVLSSECAQ